jgi:broad specificity phosphatase PhoE
VPHDDVALMTDRLVDRPPRTLYLVRHGRTHLNADGRLRGDRDPPLDDVGCAEAAALGRHFASIPIHSIVSSPLQRAVETATAIAEHHGLMVHTVASLRDRDYGPWAGALTAEVEARFGGNDAAPGVEPWTQFGERVTAALLNELTRVPHGSMLVVSHDAVNRSLLDTLTGPGPTIHQATGCWNELLWSGRRWISRGLNQLP